MLGVMLQKLLSKKWIFLCLFLGSILLVATTVSFPMYRAAVFDQMLREGFQRSLAQTGEWPARMDLWVTTDWQSQDAVPQAEEATQDLASLLGIQIKETVRYYSSSFPGILEAGRKDAVTTDLRLACYSNVTDHVTLLGGRAYSEGGLAEDGSIEIIVSQDFMVTKNLLLGDVLTLPILEDENGAPVRMTIVGIFKPNEGDLYWEAGKKALPNTCMMQEDVFRKTLFWKRESRGYPIVSAGYCYFFDYQTLRSGQVSDILRTMSEKGFAGGVCWNLLEAFHARRAAISLTLVILQVPVLVLLAAFLFMVSRQMYELERNEISVMKSRGSSSFQIFRIYLYQSALLAAASILPGLYLGVLFVRILGSASNFLEFGLRRNLPVRLDLQVWLYLAGAVAAILLTMTLPAIGHSRISIVSLKQGKHQRKWAWWEKVFLDFICLGVSLYGYYSYSGNTAALAKGVLSQQALDPLLYISSSLFIIGAGLLFLRLQPLVVRLIYVMGRRFWRPAGCVFFLDCIKNGRKQHFIMLFLILTASLGIFYATVARTILQNAQDNVEYLDGADLIVREVWRDNAAAVRYAQTDAAVQSGMTPTAPRYYEPDFLKYANMGATAYTKVYYASPDAPNAKAFVTVGGTKTDVTLLGIHTREFGEITWVDRRLTQEHYYTYLNALADNPDGILVSGSFQSQLGCRLGDKIWYYYESVMGSGSNIVRNSYLLSGTIVGFLDYWPGFRPVSLRLNYAGEAVAETNYLLVANSAALRSAFGTLAEPYEVWISMPTENDDAGISRWISDNNVSLAKYVNRREDLRQTLEDPLLQGTNGVLTMSFLVMILLCASGYLIYWVMSIRARELIFGTLRAFGMHKGELFHILVMEQVFSGILSILAGIGIGRLVSRLYVPLLQTAYAAANQVLPMVLHTNREDMLRLYGALALMMAACLFALILLVFRLDVTKALKLGEE